MSDGPHKMLPMRPNWKRLSERADTATYSAVEIAAAVCPALAEDWRVEMPDTVVQQVRKIVGADAGGFLFADQTERDLAALRSLVTSPLSGLFIDCVTQAIADGIRGEDACVAATEAALSERAVCGARQIEEHYRRRTVDARTDNVRVRLEAAIASVSIRDLAQEVLTGRSGPTGRSLVKQTGIEEGPQL